MKVRWQGGSGGKRLSVSANTVRALTVIITDGVEVSDCLYQRAREQRRGSSVREKQQGRDEHAPSQRDVTSTRRLTQAEVHRVERNCGERFRVSGFGFRVSGLLSGVGFEV